MRRPDLDEALQRVRPEWVRNRITRPVTSFAAGLHPKERIVAVAPGHGRPVVRTSKATYVLDDGGRVIETREADPTDDVAALFPHARRLDGPIDAKVESCRILGGSGFPLVAGDMCDAIFNEQGISVCDPTLNGHALVCIDYGEVLFLNINGPGAVSTGGGVVGGGFGIEGAAIGMGVAALLNAASSKTVVTTFVELICRDGELFLLCQGEEPGQLRIRLSGVFTRLRKLRVDNGDRE